MISAELQAHYDRLKAQFATPDPTVKTIAGRDWARILAKRCPVCGDVFYAYQPLDVVMEPYRVDRDPVLRTQPAQRETCGHPRCWHTEQEYQFGSIRRANTQ